MVGKLHHYFFLSFALVVVLMQFAFIEEDEKEVKESGEKIDHLHPSININNNTNNKISFNLSESEKRRRAIESKTIPKELKQYPDSFTETPSLNDKGKEFYESYDYYEEKYMNIIRGLEPDTVKNLKINK